MPPKMKHFVWKAFNHLLPFGFNLFMRKVLDNPYCSICSLHVDTNSHSLLRCSRAAKAYKPSFADIKFWVNSYLQKFYVAQDKLIISSDNNNEEASNTLLNCSNDSLAQDNVPPPLGTYKLSVDASVRDKDCKIGFGVVVQGCKGEVVGSLKSSEEDQNQLSLVTFLLAALKKSMVACRVERGEDVISSTVHQMEIGWPTNVRHITHVTFDRFNGFLGLPVEFEVEIPGRVPSAR
uniref:CRIB domain-containing protein n=1 Tax=Cannabis sativa TaxID=3483 RepID=A0A803NQD5_CANSA